MVRRHRARRPRRHGPRHRRSRRRRCVPVRCPARRDPVAMLRRSACRPARGAASAAGGKWYTRLRRSAAGQRGGPGDGARGSDPPPRISSWDRSCRICRTSWVRGSSAIAKPSSAAALEEEDPEPDGRSSERAVPDDLVRQREVPLGQRPPFARGDEAEDDLRCQPRGGDAHRDPVQHRCIQAHGLLQRTGREQRQGAGPGEERRGGEGAVAVPVIPAAGIAAATGGFELHRYILGLLLAVQLDGPVQRGLLRLLERDRHPGDRSLHLRVRMRLLVRRLAHVLVAVRIPAVERGDPDAYLDLDGAVGLGQRAALHLVAGGADFVKPMYDRVGESAFAQVEELPRRRRTEEEGDQREHGATLSETSDAAGFPGFTPGSSRAAAASRRQSAVASPLRSASRCDFSFFIRRRISSRLSALRWSTKSLPCRWSISCCTHTDSSVLVASFRFRRPSRSMYSTTMCPKRVTSSYSSGIDRQPSVYVNSPSPTLSTGSINQNRPSPFFFGSSPSAAGRWSTSIAITLRCTPTCGAASPTPLASYIVSAMSSHSLRIFASTSPTGLAFCFRRGSGQIRISRNAMPSRSSGVRSDSNTPVYSQHIPAARMGFRSAAQGSQPGDGVDIDRHLYPSGLMG